VILLAAAGGFCVALSLSAQADVVEPKSAYQPASVGLLEKGAPGTDVSVPEGQQEAAVPKVQEAKEAPVAEEVPATPAPEQQVVRQVPTAIAPSATREAPSLADRIVHPFQVGLEHIRATLGRAVSACKVGFGAGAGGPVLVLGVLCMAIPFTRRRVLGTRRAADEDAPEFLFAWELTPPG
jgi:hypothetical protein